MNKEIIDEGLIEVLLERLEKQRLPRLFDIKQKVDDGTTLEDFDLAFLEKAMSDAKKSIPLFDRHPDYQPLIAKVMALYKDISEKSTQIESKV